MQQGQFLVLVLNKLPIHRLRRYNKTEVLICLRVHNLLTYILNNVHHSDNVLIIRCSTFSLEMRLYRARLTLIEVIRAHGLADHCVIQSRGLGQGFEVLGQLLVQPRRPLHQLAQHRLWTRSRSFEVKVAEKHALTSNGNGSVLYSTGNWVGNVTLFYHWAIIIVLCIVTSRAKLLTF